MGVELEGGGRDLQPPPSARSAEGDGDGWMRGLDVKGGRSTMRCCKVGVC